MGMTRYARNPRIVDRRMDDDSFLVNPDDDALYQLNTIATAVWHLLARPVAVDDIAASIAAAFPEVAYETVRDDVGRVIEELAGRGLIAPHNGPAA